VNVFDGEAADCGGPLGVEENEQSGDAVVGFDAVVVQQPAGVDPSGFAVDGAPWPVPFGGGEVQAGDLVSSGPAHEVTRVDAGGRVCAGQPLLEIAVESAV